MLYENNKKYLIVSGDSFTDKNMRSAAYPDMDTSWPKWPEILGKKLNMEVINLAYSGSGNEYIFSTLQDCVMDIPKERIGLVVAAWSQAQRRDFQTGYKSGTRSWDQERVDSCGDLMYFTRRSLRYFLAFQHMCERYDLPYFQTQMIDLYKDYIDGLAPTEREVVIEGKDLFKDGMTYPGDKKRDEEELIQLILSYENKIDTSKFIGWPITRTLGGWPVNRGVIGWSVEQEAPYVIDEHDNHPNAAGQELIAEYFYDWLG